MCFSAAVSFAAAAALVPAGGWAVAAARRRGGGWTALAAFPLAFAALQAAEGVVWLGLGTGDRAREGGEDGTTAVAAHVFLFFSHFFWLVWTPLATLRIEPRPGRRRALRLLLAAGAVFGASIYLPLLLLEGWVSVGIEAGSIRYDARSIYDAILPEIVPYLIYGAIILSALFLSSHRRIRAFGALVAATLVLAAAFYSHAFVSVWCFFAAAASLAVVAIVTEEARRRPAAG